MASIDNNVALENKLARVDVRQKVDGSAKYGSDQYPKNLIYVKFIRFPYGKGRVTSSDVEAARKVKGVLEVELNADKQANYAGFRLGHIVAESRDAIADAEEALALKYRIEDSVSRPDEHYEGVPKLNAEDEQKIASILNSADTVVEATYQTQVQTHSCLETHGSTVDHRGDSCEAWVSTQGVMGFQDGLTNPTGLRASEILVHAEYVGGGFGSKFGPGAEGNLAAEISKKYKRPCKYFLDRYEEHLDVGNRPGSIQYMKLGVNKDGKIAGGRLHIVGITGENGQGGGVRNPIGDFYDFGQVERTEATIALNAGNSRAFRAPGWPQGVFAVESMMDELAKAIGMDPLEFRLKNERSERRRKQYKMGAEAIGWSKRKADGTGSGRVKRGMGLGSSMWPIWNTACEAECLIHRDGHVEVRSGVQDIGTGAFTVVTDVACEELGLDRSMVTGKVGLSSYPPGPASGGSVTSRSLAPAVQNACRAARDELAKLVAKEWGIDADNVEAQGSEFHESGGSRKTTWLKASALMSSENISGRGKSDTGQEGKGTSDGVQFAEVSVDTETGIVRVEKIVIVQACGQAVNRHTVENQMYGGVIQGISFALFEDRRLDGPTGGMVNADFLGYKIAGPVDVPEIIPILDVTDEDTGVRSLGEPTTIPTSGAIANAVANAIGVRVRSLPITPQRVLEALESKGGMA